MNFHLIASGSKGNCFILEVGNRVIVVDCGGSKKNIVNAFDALNIEKVDMVLITHDHSDHIKQIKMFKDNNIYSPVEIENIFVNKIEAYNKIYLDDIEISVIPVSHDAKSTVGYIFNVNSKKLVYITDTGYINSKYIDLLYGADYIVIESNHDIKMLMDSNRPQYIKSRIYSDVGHLCNEDCARTLEQIVTNTTKTIFLAHISQDANTYEKALSVNVKHLLETKRNVLNKNLRIVASKQFEIISGGSDYEKNNNSFSYFIGNEPFSVL